MLVLRKSGIGLLIFICLVTLFFVTWTIVASIITATIQEKIESGAKFLEDRTGIFITAGDIRVYPNGKVVLKNFSASFHRHGIPFLSLSMITVRGKPGPWLSSFFITGIEVDSITLRASLESITSRDSMQNFFAGYFPGTGTKVPKNGVSRTEGGVIRPGKNVEILVKKGTLYAAKYEEGTLGHLPLIHSMRVCANFNSENREMTGDFAASGTYQTDNVTGSFIVNPHNQIISLDVRAFRTKSLDSFFPRSLEVDDDSSLDVRVSMYKYASNPFIQCDIKGYVDKLTINNRRVSMEPVRELRGGIRGIVRIDVRKRIIESDELKIFFGKALLYLRNVKFRLTPSLPLFAAITLETEGLRLQDIIDSLPRGLIPRLKDTKVDGIMDISASLIVDMEDIENTFFDITGGISRFRVISPPPSCDVREIASLDYVHTVHLPGTEQVRIVVGPSNSDFVPMRKTGRYVIESVLTCEDGNFYVHNGFQLKHVNGAIRENLREKRFVRGASTVSMQLVKNLFLSNEKTISRKLEEIMLTWWMEREVEKKRMFEVYLNIIEWGPGIFGIGPASAHYFSRKPSELSLTQATWLASILINPSLFYYMKENKRIDNSMRSMIRYVLKAILRQGGISEKEFLEAEKINYEVLFP